MPIIREEVFKYVDLWNRHAIQKQPKRPHVVTGKPIMNYFWPKTGVERFQQEADASVWEGLEADFSG